jgi:hypothetical protein
MRQNVSECGRVGGRCFWRSAWLIRSVSNWVGFIGAAVDVDYDDKVEVGLGTSLISSVLFG